MAQPALIDGRYRLERVLGTDGADQAWLAHDQVLDRRVVVRVLPSEQRSNQAAAEAFGAAVRTMARAGTVDGRRVLDAGDDAAAGTPFAVLEWIDEPVAVAADAGATRPIPRPTASAAPEQPVAAPPRVRRRRRGSRLPIWLLILVLAVVAIAVGLRLVPANRSATSDSNAGLAPTTLPAPTAAPAPTRAQATATASIAGQRRKIANTDGQGVALRASPGGERLPGHGYDEGDTVTLLEENSQWAHIRGDDGREGWVLAVTLVPISSAGR